MDQPINTIGSLLPTTFKAREVARGIIRSPQREIPASYSVTRNQFGAYLGHGQWVALQIIHLCRT